TLSSSTHFSRGMKNPLLYKFPSKMTYAQALRLTTAASFWSEGKVPSAR
ncbi:hypothetical protein A2U01_0066895, partial [Trifolium medium]|nr:hypothetical protein [Trifolium medium]